MCIPNTEQQLQQSPEQIEIEIEIEFEFEFEFEFGLVYVIVSHKRENGKEIAK